VAYSQLTHSYLHKPSNKWQLQKQIKGGSYSNILVFHKPLTRLDQSLFVSKCSGACLSAQQRA